MHFLECLRIFEDDFLILDLVLVENTFAFENSGTMKNVTQNFIFYVI